ncbi:MAG: response regulator transcription factor [Tissierellales bacterium]|jgi:DNA-binding response OmpR family regulator|nr:response regulator transcription factor [Tissierellales bacterium]
MNQTILIIEDEQQIRQIIKDFFAHEGFVLLEAKDGEEGLELFESNKVDLILLDIMMPKIDGWSVCRRIRKTSDVPIVIMTARGDEDDQLLGYDLKADDYVVKPFSPAILVAKCKNLLNRLQGDINSSNLVKADNIEIRTLSREVFLDGKELSLTFKEYELLLYMIQNQNIALSRETILKEVWGYDFWGENRVVDSHIKKLRKHLGTSSQHIKTIFGVGYKFEVNS